MSSIITLSAAERAPALLAELHLPVAVRRVRGRYVTSPSRLSGVSYWATSMPRFKRDGFGLQFEGEGLKHLDRLKAPLLRAGFVDRGEVQGRETFERALPFGPDGTFNEAALVDAKRAADQVLSSAPDLGGPNRTFREFMLASPWADVEIDLPERIIEAGRPIDL